MGKHLDMMETDPRVKREVERIEGELEKLPGNPLGRARVNIAEMDCFVKDRRGTQQYRDWQQESAGRAMGDPNAESFLSYMARKYPDTPDGRKARELQDRYEENRRDLYEKALPLAEENTANPAEAQRRANLAVDDASDTAGNCEALRKGPSAGADPALRHTQGPPAGKMTHAKIGG